MLLHISMSRKRRLFMQLALSCNDGSGTSAALRDAERRQSARANAAHLSQAQLILPSCNTCNEDLRDVGTVTVQHSATRIEQH
eukprot:4366420-Amphidinium_carterae.1